MPKKRAKKVLTQRLLLVHSRQIVKYVSKLHSVLNDIKIAEDGKVDLFSLGRYLADSGARFVKDSKIKC